MPNMIEIRRERILVKLKFIKEWKTFIDKKRKKEGGEKVVDEKIELQVDEWGPSHL